jgi:hypothetical protein
LKQMLLRVPTSGRLQLVVHTLPFLAPKQKGSHGCWPSTVGGREMHRALGLRRPEAAGAATGSGVSGGGGPQVPRAGLGQVP